VATAVQRTTVRTALTMRAAVSVGAAVSMGAAVSVGTAVTMRAVVAAVLGYVLTTVSALSLIKGRKGTTSSEALHTVTVRTTLLLT
jgi:uncharacterized membrane protein YgaE (UPF0421/DUF939 family)